MFAHNYIYMLWQLLQKRNERTKTNTNTGRYKRVSCSNLKEYWRRVNIPEAKVKLAQDCYVYFNVIPSDSKQNRWQLITEIWFGSASSKMSVNCIKFVPGEEFETVLPDGRECRVIILIEDNVMTSYQVPLCSEKCESSPDTLVIRQFTQDGFILRMECEGVISTQEFIRCLEDS
ncbi:fatty acid-binding protein homolog 6 [Eurytemora carolleeae]|uniref:fatty acid-binding protein homolog 6 n=1 Tax=Eurytemora carolleeae TaxID=1294199 RepID=UPI000C772150|nr:fatty acid-binding protein homolog 6 [Eurytemora carolleeae]|eukprot:XP_023345380.1 fatty acid-binding protein homolog 6-like [Eurytemora affinis]